MFIPASAVHTAEHSTKSRSTSTSTSGSCSLASTFTRPHLPLPTSRDTEVAFAEARLDSSRGFMYLGPRSDETYMYPHAIHRRAPHGDKESATAVLAGVLGGFGGLCAIACVVWVVRRRRARKARELEKRRTRERKQAKAERKAMAEDGARSQEAEGRRAVDLSNVSTAAQRPKPGEGVGRPSSSSQRSPGEHPGNSGKTAKVPSPLSREAQLPSSPQGHSKAAPHSSPQAPRPTLPQAKQSPRPRPPELPRVPVQDAGGRPETPTIPVHPPLAFSDSSPTNNRPSDSNQVPPTRRYRHPRVHVVPVGDAGLGQDASDTEYFSDASAAGRQTLTNMGDRGGSGNNPRTHRSPRVQQTVVVDLPPAYTPDPH